MPTTLATDFKVYPEQFWAGYAERLAQVVDVFNGSSAGAIRLVSRRSRGNHELQSFFQRVSGLIAHRNNSVDTAVADKKLTQGEVVNPKVNRRIGPVKAAIDAFTKIGADPESFSFLLGQQTAEDVLQDYLQTITTSMVAALGSVAALKHDATDGVLAATDLNEGQFKLGDRASRIRAWLMHSGALKGLINQQIGDKMESVAGVIVYGGSPATMGRPVIVTDAPALTYSDGGTRYRTLGLVDMAGEVIESEGRTVMSQQVLGEENLSVRIQGEYAFNVSVKGFAFNKAEINPNEATYGAGANWTQVAASVKDCAGVLIESQ